MPSFLSRRPYSLLDRAFRQDIENLVGGFFACIGLLFVGCALFWGRTQAEFMRHAVPVQGTVIGFSHPDDADYILFGYEFPAGVPRSGSDQVQDSRAYAMGGPVPLYVDTLDPRQAQIRGFGQQWLGPIAFGGIGAAFAAIGAGCLVFGFRKRRLNRFLLIHGVPVRADVVGVVPNPAVDLNGMKPWLIRAQAKIDGRLYRFESANIWIDPAPHLGKHVEVRHLEGNPRRYVMDISFLPEAAD